MLLSFPSGAVRCCLDSRYVAVAGWLFSPKKIACPPEKYRGLARLRCCRDRADTACRRVYTEWSILVRGASHRKAAIEMIKVLRGNNLTSDFKHDDLKDADLVGCFSSESNWLIQLD